jgi:hypothetical protein
MCIYIYIYMEGGVCGWRLSVLTDLAALGEGSVGQLAVQVLGDGEVEQRNHLLWRAHTHIHIHPYMYIEREGDEKMMIQNV